MLEALNGAMANLKSVIVEKNMDVRDAQRDNVAVMKDLLEIVTDTLVLKVDMTHLVNPQERSASGETGVGAAQKDV